MKVSSYKLKNGQKKWMAKGYIGIDPKTGKRQNPTIRGKRNKTEAIRAFNDAKYELEHGIRKKQHKLTFQEIYDKWWPIYEPSVEKSTALKTKRIFKNHILPVFGDNYMDQIEIIDVQSWLIKLSQKMASYRKVTAYASMLFKFAVRMKYINQNPFDYVETPHKAKKPKHIVKKNYYDINELTSFIHALNAITSEDQSIDHNWTMARAFLMLVLTTGMRRGEALALKWQDINFNKKIIAIHHAQKRDENGVYFGHTKSKAGMRTISLEPLAAEALHAWHMKQAIWLSQYGRPEISPKSWIFTNRNDPNKTMSENTPRRWMVDLCETKHLRRITIHGLRHTKATLMSEAGAQVNDIAAILGHASGDFTLKQYIHTTNTGITSAENIYQDILNQINDKNAVKMQSNVNNKI